MVTVAVRGVPRVICVSPDVMLVSVTTTVSLSSKIRLSTTFTSMVAVVLPASMVTVPERVA